MPCGGLTAALVGMVFGLPSLRIKGLYLALATLAAHFIIIWVLLEPLASLTGGALGIKAPAPTLGGLTFKSDQSFYYIALVVTILMTFFAKNLLRTSAGRAFVAIRDNDLAAEVMGISLFRYKLLAFFIGCFYAGVAGSLLCHDMGWAHVEHFTLDEAVWYVGMLIVGGMGSTVGVVFGVVFLKLLSEFAVMLGPIAADAIPAISAGISAALAQLLFALVIIGFLVYEPRGLAHRWGIIKASYRLWPFSY
jgi:branched-chain amino acid transport system permease protein